MNIGVLLQSDNGKDIDDSTRTIQRRSPFSDLPVVVNQDWLEQNVLDSLVAPFCLSSKYADSFKPAYLKLRQSVDVRLVSRLLGEPNWRSRSVGAYFAAIEDMQELEQVIGHLLLRSELSNAGLEYCLALASFATPSAIDVLQCYLNYYLQQNDLWFDQGHAMAALNYLGRQRNKNFLSGHQAAWDLFVQNKSEWSLQRYIERFDIKMHIVIRLKHQLKVRNT